MIRKHANEVYDSFDRLGANLKDNESALSDDGKSKLYLWELAREQQPNDLDLAQPPRENAGDTPRIQATPTPETGKGAAVASSALFGFSGVDAEIRYPYQYAAHYEECRKQGQLFEWSSPHAKGMFLESFGVPPLFQVRLASTPEELGQASSLRQSIREHISWVNEVEPCCGNKDLQYVPVPIPCEDDQEMIGLWINRAGKIHHVSSYWRSSQDLPNSDGHSVSRKNPEEQPHIVSESFQSEMASRTTQSIGGDEQGLLQLSSCREESARNKPNVQDEPTAESRSAPAAEAGREPQAGGGSAPSPCSGLIASDKQVPQYVYSDKVTMYDRNWNLIEADS